MKNEYWNLVLDMEMLAKMYHRGQEYGEDYDYFTYHVARVAAQVNEECNKLQLNDRICAISTAMAYGHDLFEDTKMTPDLLTEILETLGHPQGVIEELVRGIALLTFHEGLHTRIAYYKDILQYPNVALVKYCDAYINYVKSVTTGSKRRQVRYKDLMGYMGGTLELPEDPNPPSAITPSYKG